MYVRCCVCVSSIQVLDSNTFSHSKGPRCSTLVAQQVKDLVLLIHCCCGIGSTPGLETSTCHEHGQKKLKVPGFLRKMADFKAGAGYDQNDPRTFCYAGKKGTA